jgi:6-phosphofructokinase 1
MTKKNCLIGQSGGPTAVINASLKGIIDAVYGSDIDEIYGMKYGIEGALKGKLIDLSKKSSGELKLFKNTPSSILGTCRYKIDHYNDNEEDYYKLFNMMKDLDIKYLFYIGGNDSMDTVYKLDSYAREKGIDIKIMGIPKTIDNDLVGTDHCPGYGSAAKYIATSVMEIARDSLVYDIKNVHIVEVMGRATGWLAASSILASTEKLYTPDLIYVPEIEFSTSDFVNDVKKKMQEKKAVTVVVSEGIKDKHGEYISADSSTEHDKFGHKKMGGAASVLAPFIKGNLCNRVKAIKFDVMQRAAAHCASGRDIEEAYLLGEKAVEAALMGESGLMTSLKRISNNPYKIEIIKVPAEKVANKVKTLPDKYINDAKNRINDEFKEYVMPLIQGDSGISYKNSLPDYAKLDCLNEDLFINYK